MKKIPLRISGRYLLIFAVLLLTVPVVIFPDRYVSSVWNGFKLFALSVLPALFPFFFFTKILSGLNFGYDLGLVLKKPLGKIFRAPASSGYILAMSMLCGYPVGAKLVADFCEKGYISAREAKAVSAFTSTSGPLFIVGTVGVGMLGNKTAGFIILISHYLSALLNGIIFRPKETSSVTLPARPLTDYNSLLSEGIYSALSSVAVVGGYVAIFNLVLDLFADIGIISLLSAPLQWLGLGKTAAQGTASSLVEITKGCLLLSESGYPLSITAPLCAFGITFGGLSVTLQSLTFLGKSKISPLYYLLTKSVQGVTAFIFCKALCLLLL